MPIVTIIWVLIILFWYYKNYRFFSYFRKNHQIEWEQAGKPVWFSPLSYQSFRKIEWEILTGKFNSLGDPRLQKITRQIRLSIAGFFVVALIWWLLHF